MERPLSPADRRTTARRSLATPAGRRADSRRLDVQCSHGHHVAQVYDADSGLVYVSDTGARSHGRGDRVDTGHIAGRRRGAYVDLLDPGEGAIDDDDLPASCECGPRTLSRSGLLAAVARGQRHMRLR